MVSIGNKVADFNLPATGNKTVSLSDFSGKVVVLYFYPKDNTPGCTTESVDFSHFHEQFVAVNCVVLGISRDSIKKHENFKSKYEMPFDLLSDEDDVVCRAFDVIKMKSMYGKQFEGIERSTFLIDADGVLRQEWRKVKVKGHVEEVLVAAQSL
ncbi:MAG: peroxiredoxin [Pseudomonadota bacterium]